MRGDRHCVATREHRRKRVLVEVGNFRRIGHGAAVGIAELRRWRIVQHGLHRDRLAVADLILHLEINEVRRLDFKARLEHGVAVDRIADQFRAEAVASRRGRCRREGLSGLVKVAEL